MTDLDRPYHGTPSTEPLWGSLRKPDVPITTPPAKAESAIEPPLSSQP